MQEGSNPTTESVRLGQVLSEELSRRQERRPRYSLRAFARQLELSPSFLCELMTGKKRASPKTTSRLLEKISVSSPD